VVGGNLRNISTLAEIIPLRHSDAWLKAELAEAPDSIRTSELISALSYALDLTEGRSMGHSVRSCVIGMRLAQRIGMTLEEQADLYYTLLLKDAGCSSFHIRCGRGEFVATCVTANCKLSNPIFVQSVVLTSRLARISSAFRM
jgi:hypothetical protein